MPPAGFAVLAAGGRAADILPARSGDNPLGRLTLTMRSAQACMSDA
jgi:hypothetical protein